MSERAQVEEAIRTAMVARGWRPECIATLPEAYVIDKPITPYYWPLMAVDAYGKYSISGCIGVIDREFEANWKGENPRDHAFPLCLLSVNMRELIGGFFHPKWLVPDVDNYLGLLVGVLERLPADKASLRAAFEADSMAGIEMETWGLMSEGDRVVSSPKYLAYRSYILAR